MKNVGLATKIGISVVSIIVVWFLVGAVLWFAYGMSPLIQGGYYSQRAALTLVSEFASIICVIVALVWIFSIARSFADLAACPLNSIQLELESSRNCERSLGTQPPTSVTKTSRRS